MANVINAVEVGATVSPTVWGGFIAVKGEVSAEHTSEQGALRMLLRKLTAAPVAQPVAPAAAPVATAAASKFTPEEQAILLLTGHLKQEAVYYVSKKDGSTRVGLPRAFSFNAQRRLRWMAPAERCAELGAWCLARGIPNFFSGVATPTAEHIATAKVYCRKGAASPPAQPVPPVVPVQAAAQPAAPAGLDPAMAAAIAQAVAQAMAAFMAQAK